MTDFQFVLCIPIAALAVAAAMWAVRFVAECLVDPAPAPTPGPNRLVFNGGGPAQRGK